MTVNVIRQKICIKAMGIINPWIESLCCQQVHVLLITKLLTFDQNYGYKYALMKSFIAFVDNNTIFNTIIKMRSSLEKIR